MSNNNSAKIIENERWQLDIKLSVYYINVRGLNSKLDSIKNISVLVNPDLFVFTETWVKDKIPYIEGYKWYGKNP